MINFSLDDQQLLIEESLTKFLNNNYSFEQRNAMIEQYNSSSPEIWQQFAELGWLAIPFSEALGGLGGRAADLRVIMQAFGRALVVEPFVESVVIAGKLLEQSTASELAKQWLERTINGEAKVVFAAQEQAAQYRCDSANTQLKKVGAGYQLKGEKSLVIHAEHSDALLVSATIDGQTCVCLIPSDAEGVHMTHIETLDGKSAAQIHFKQVELEADAIILQGDACDAALIQLNRWLSIALAAECIGIMQALIEKTVAYAKTRKQFGFPISFFQALQHRMVDMDLHYEQSVSLLHRSMQAFDEEGEDCALELAALRVYIAKAAKKIAEEAIQIHGGMGLTDELDIGHFAKRLLLINHYYGCEIALQTDFCQLAYAS